MSERKSAYSGEGVSEKPLNALIVPMLRVGMQPGTLCVPKAERGASVEAFPRRAWERSFTEKHLSVKPMPLHLFIERPARQLQFFKHRLHITLVPGQCCAQALRFKRFLLRCQ